MEGKKEILITLPRKRPFKNVYQVKITLLDTNPPVWRRLLVPESFSFYDLHVAIQDSMGWHDSHLHMFEIEDENRRGKIIRVDCPFGDVELEPEDNYLTTEVPLKAFFKKEGDRMLYTYDFGDNWEHEVLLEKIFPKEPKNKYPTCIGGELSCPPEDCGSIPGYYECIKALKKKDNSEDLLDWLGTWKPDNFSGKKVIFQNPRQRLKLVLDD